jgi:hypothetical protein
MAWLALGQSANRSIYGFDLVRVAERFPDVVLRASKQAA